MAESGVGMSPQVFVVDSQANYDSVLGRKKPWWARVGQKFLLLLIGFTVLGLAVEGCLIYNLYKKTEALCEFHPLCQNVSRPQTSRQKGGTSSSEAQPQGSNEISKVQPHLEKWPFAQLLGTNIPSKNGSVVQWRHSGGETYLSNMGYDNGHLVVNREGYYYLYSKVTTNAAEECSLILHKVMKVTQAYDKPIELMKSKSFRCPKPPSEKPPEVGEDLWNSFLSGIFQLQSGDKIFVTLENQEIRQGSTENLMGAFMIPP
ncbi:tumor necrosis factor ligand superfamily member 14-like [Sparus aurata]|uniref:Tumor necrosis factor ligand superfamily member 14-like n=1 Tax=Sparus aurata TaxID=8175 RepID=A0A671WTZ2_SPAAU|nr:tumor necrosis factor ligand superfamily member 14-like [Sparus aurata]XP_030248216.1 tumor necrosis factor ligand superfamily member 14-like [Sparus aurata]XP_030248292.1 tumor necrosis factor ligand superfamily member 14-like [Sparus aurata]